MSIIDTLLEENTFLTTDIASHQLRFVLRCLDITLKKNLQGDIVELGCYEGTTSLFIRRVLDFYKPDKQFFVYDSFERPLLNPHRANICLKQDELYPQTEKKRFIRNFSDEGLELPIINEGWFADIPDEKYPDKISFAFFGGDSYVSVTDSFVKTYHKLSPCSIVCVRNYTQVRDVRKACLRFLADKPEVIFASRGLGYMVKE